MPCVLPSSRLRTRGPERPGTCPGAHSTVHGASLHHPGSPGVPALSCSAFRPKSQPPLETWKEGFLSPWAAVSAEWYVQPCGLSKGDRG